VKPRRIACARGDESEAITASMGSDPATRTRSSGKPNESSVRAWKSAIGGPFNIPSRRSPAGASSTRLAPRLRGSSASRIASSPVRQWSATSSGAAGGRCASMVEGVARKGSAPSTPGQKLVLLDERTATGTVGGGAVERVVLAAMLAALADPEAAPRVETFRLGASLGMCCGGSADILIEPLDAQTHALVVGAGHVGVFTAPLLASLGFRVTLCDSREAAADPARIPGPAVRLVHAEHDDPEVLQGFPARLDRTALLVMTHDHQVDQAVIAWTTACLREPPTRTRPPKGHTYTGTHSDHGLVCVSAGSNHSSP
jgi:hypothetical protein